MTGPVEIIGNIMEISNLLQKKSVSEKDIQADGEGSTTPERHISKSELSVPAPFSSEINAETGRRLSTTRDTNSPCLGIAASAALSESKARGDPGSPAVARVAPHRVEIGEDSIYSITAAETTAMKFFYLYVSNACAISPSSS